MMEIKQEYRSTTEGEDIWQEKSSQNESSSVTAQTNLRNFVTSNSGQGYQYYHVSGKRWDTLDGVSDYNPAQYISSVTNNERVFWQEGGLIHYSDRPVTRYYFKYREPLSQATNTEFYSHTVVFPLTKVQ
jgi:hypothetical protein